MRERAGRVAVANMQTSFVMFGAGLLQGDVSTGATLLAGFLRGNREFAAGATPQFLKDYVAAQGTGSGVLSECRSYSVPDGRIDPKSIQTHVDWSVERKYSPRAVAAESLIDQRFLEIAQKETRNR